jgi:hypothetical protein
MAGSPASRSSEKPEGNVIAGGDIVGRDKIEAGGDVVGRDKVEAGDHAVVNTGPSAFATGEGVAVGAIQVTGDVAGGIQVGDRSGEGNAFWGLAICCEADKDIPQAIAHAQAALEIFTAIESPSAQTMRDLLAKWRGQK